MSATVRKAGIACCTSLQSISRMFSIIRAPTRISAGPVAYGGMDEIMGVKNIAMKK